MSLIDRKRLLLAAVAVLCFVFVEWTPARAETISESEVVDIASHYWPAREIPRLVRVVRCESEFDTQAVSAGWDRVFGRYEYLGLLQISEDLWGWDATRLMGYPADLHDPVVNLAVGAFIWSIYGYAAWPVCGYR